MNDENSMEVLSQLQLHSEGKKKWLVVPVHEWPPLGNRPGGVIFVEGWDGSYRVVVRENVASPDAPYQKTVWVGGLEHALKNAFSMRAKYKRNGLE